MYSNKYPGSGPVPPPPDNNLAINTAQGGGRRGRGPPQGGPCAPGSATAPPALAGPARPPPPWFQPHAGRAGSDGLCSDAASERRGRTRAGRTGQPSSCGPKMPGEGLCAHSRLVKGFGEAQVEGMGRRGVGHPVAGGAGPAQSPGRALLQLGPARHRAPRRLLRPRWEGMRPAQRHRTRAKRTGLPEAGQAGPLPPRVPQLSPPAPKLDRQQEGKNAPKRIIQWLLGGKNRYCVGSFHQTTA